MYVDVCSFVAIYIMVVHFSCYFLVSSLVRIIRISNDEMCSKCRITYSIHSLDRSQGVKLVLWIPCTELQATKQRSQNSGLIC